MAPSSGHASCAQDRNIFTVNRTTYIHTYIVFFRNYFENQSIKSHVVYVNTFNGSAIGHVINRKYYKTPNYTLQNPHLKLIQHTASLNKTDKYRQVHSATQD